MGEVEGFRFAGEVEMDERYRLALKKFADHRRYKVFMNEDGEMRLIPITDECPECLGNNFTMNQWDGVKSPCWKCKGAMPNAPRDGSSE